MRRHYKTVDSTNEAAKIWARDTSEPAPHGAIVTADSQSAGRGRLGRDWASPAGKGVYLSAVWRPQLSLEESGRLALIVALAAAHALEEAADVKVQTKWPNDVLLDGRKVGGILCEGELEGGRLKFAIAGVGLNINFEEQDLPERPLYPATSLLIATGEEYEIQDVCDGLARSLETEYKLLDTGKWDAQRGEFIQRCVLIGEHVKVDTGMQVVEGLATGIDDAGSLLVQTSDGMQTVSAGDASLL